MRSWARLFAAELEGRLGLSPCVVPEQDHCVELGTVIWSIKECACCEDGTIFIVRSEHRLLLFGDSGKDLCVSQKDMREQKDNGIKKI